jgi:4a-hydroxytetrahydrobiopterin dehydratase
MATLLSSDEVATELAHLAGWSGDPTVIQRSITAPTFLDGIRIVDAVAQAAEEADHHPDILVHGRNKVRLTFSTYSEGGITQSDLDMAATVDGLT